MISQHMRVGRCIYCGTTAGKLTREHVMPRGLGGYMSPQGSHQAFVLNEASCEQCRETTRAIEEECLTRMFPHARAKLGMRRKDRRPSLVEVEAVLPDGTTEMRQVPPSDALGAIVIPRFDHAEVLGVRTSAHADLEFFFPPELKASKHAMAGITKMGIRCTANIPRFAQLLAKISLGAAVATFGMDGFHPLIRDFIRFLPNDYRRWVGCFGKGEEQPTSSLHHLHMEEVETPNGTFIVCHIRLFARFGCPSHYVVVGKPLTLDRPVRISAFATAPL
jgi:hypothetical protein